MASQTPNPFSDRPKRDPMRTYEPMSAREMLALDRAPSKGQTRVTVRSYDIPWLWGKSEHAYTEYDDGREQFILRGGPSAHGVHAEVTPARESRDYRKGQRVLVDTTVPGTARQAIRPAQQTVRRVEDSGAPYLGLVWNSNSVNADNAEDQLGVRVGDRLTPGWRTRIPRIPEWARARSYPMTQPIW